MKSTGMPATEGGETVVAAAAVWPPNSMSALMTAKNGRPIFCMFESLENSKTGPYWPGLIEIC
jgi:hypothetical protein